ncbi:hypothetical protein SAMN02745181_0070 [Rubritalea squalenifaciens DSM 18772]|uniref:CAAX prenyl protease 2/Lysostaphin resistance protein A-like domain-containing protein n=1 Tax=Rubritalea squalenifaciens DSM 18772 TaxID=1123071 RepID=A0A1M6AYS4_9BACT|nr:CPBP family intramembrane glutamic endopeptidase [Rubritalea squalenifaciens]SHI41383.1 hypothetical protein SAMN02745181_0070 [Rubritalea squalenifaciens DSM 18772]
MEFIASLSAEAFEHNILQDVILICIVSYVFASLFYGMLRARSRGLHWNQLGKVPVDHLGVIDIAVAAILVLMFAGPYLLPYNPPDPEKKRTITDSMIILGFSTQIFFAGVTCFVVSLRHNVTESFGLYRSNLLVIVGSAVASFILMLASMYLLDSVLQLNDWLTERLGERQFQEVVNQMMSAEGQRLLILIIGACIVAPLCEEIIFRGYLYSVTKRYTGPIFAAICTGVLFGAVHGEVWSFIPLSILGIILACVYEFTGSLWSSILTHALFNGVSTFYMTHPEYSEQIKNACLLPFC